jgi:hypothetical protein
MVQRSLTAVINKIEQDLDRVRTEFLINVAEDLVRSSTPTVDTGAYITSHSITTTRGAGRGRTSANKPQGQDPNAKATEALSQLMGDIASLPQDQTQVFITNNAPHANLVESGGANWRERPNGYQVYTSVRNRAGLHLADAVNKVKGSQ